MNTITKTFDGLERVIKAVCSVLVVGFTGMTLIQVIARYVLSAPIWWSEQFCRYLFIWMLMLYAPVIIRHGQNLGFDLFVKRLPKKAQDILLLVCEILIGAFGGCYAFYSIQLCEKFANKIMEGIRLPAPVMYSSQVVGGALILLFSIEVVAKHIIRLRSGKEVEGK